MGLKGQLTNVEADTWSLTPRLKFTVEYESDSDRHIDIFAITGDVKLNKNGSYGGLATLSPFVGKVSIPPNRRNRAALDLDLTNHIIGIVEEVRKGRDVKLAVDTRLLYSQEKEDGTEELGHTNVRLKSPAHPQADWVEIPQSKWVKILDEMGYARFKVIELPIPEPPKGTDIDKSLKHLEKGLKSFYEGDYEVVLGNCRKAIEQLSKKLTKQKLAGLLKSESKAEKIWAIQAKTRDFTNLGAHAGTKVDQRDAEIALHCTMSLIRYAARNLAETA